MTAPFKQLAFDALPQRPRVAHVWSTVEPLDVVVDDPHFGRVKLRVNRFGSGPPLLLVHGLMTASYSWRYMLERLGAHFTLYMPDLPGCGRSDAPDVDYGPDALADLIARLIGVLGIRGTAVIGNSLGGYLVMRLALRDPGSVSRIINLHSPGIPLPRLYALRAALSLPGAAAILDALVARDPERWVHRNVHYYDETLKSREEAAVWAEPLRTTAGRRAFFHWLRDSLDPGAMREFVAVLVARRDRGEAFPVPIRLIYAERDPMVPPIVGRRLAALLPAAPIVWLDAGSHFAHVDAPDAFVTAIGDFLDQR
jgi:pimeloyl-ACP methyl ester carboxylesterase